MANQSVEDSPQRYARIGGALYLAIIVLGAFSEGFVANKLVVSGDAAATAHNILAAQELWRLSVAGDLTVVLFAVQLLWIEYLLLRPVSKHADLITPAVLIPSLIGESSFCLWLLVKGVNIAKWKERVSMGQEI